MAIDKLFQATEQRALPLSKGADLRMSLYNPVTDPPTPFPLGTKAILEIDYMTSTVRFDAKLVNGALEFVLDSTVTDGIPATTANNKVSWRLRVAFANDPDVELPVYEGPVYRNKHG